MTPFHQAGKSPLPLPSPFVLFYPFAGGGVLFLEGTRRVWGLNTSAAFLWQSLETIRRFDELAEALAKKFHLDETTAMRDTAATLTCFEKEGLLGDKKPVDLPEEGADWEIPSSAVFLKKTEKWPLRGLFQTPRHVIEFCSHDPGPGRSFVEHMGHLSIKGEVKAQTQLAVIEDDGSWDIYLNGRRFVEGAAEKEVLPHLFTLVFVRTCAALRNALLFHASVVGREQKLVLFPAEAGCGKTTLSAAMAARGWRFFSDELAVIDPGSLRVTPFPMPMSIKPGSLPALERYYPGLASGALHYRADGKHVRYLSPPPDSLAGLGNSAAIADIIVYPLYSNGAQTRLSPLGKIDALQRLATTGSSDREFLSGDIEAMLALVEKSPSFELVFSNLEEALELLEELIHC